MRKIQFLFLFKKSPLIFIIKKDGKLKARLRIKQQKQTDEKHLWLWTALAMYDDRIYAMDYISNKIEVFHMQKNK